ncbi:hypothetical protein AVEN_9087-1 [Araneus ventricosus]|uniref:Uncharacterized protein n=1 Tax=Araneus ventricosus TaxID=182803 RepID=A0A4Y2UN97_ARAVE|nr:hypothetical protein AVEN_9087-1 [Araneus ventricosus]
MSVFVVCMLFGKGILLDLGRIWQQVCFGEWGIHLSKFLNLSETMACKSALIIPRRMSMFRFHASSGRQTTDLELKSSGTSILGEGIYLSKNSNHLKLYLCWGNSYNKGEECL